MDLRGHYSGLQTRVDMGVECVSLKRINFQVLKYGSDPPEDMCSIKA